MVSDDESPALKALDVHADLVEWVLWFAVSMPAEDMTDFNHRANVLVVTGWWGFTKLNNNQFLFNLSLVSLIFSVSSKYFLKHSTTLQRLLSSNL